MAPARCRHSAGTGSDTVHHFQGVGGGIGQTAALGSLYKKGVVVEEGLFEELEKIVIKDFNGII